MLTDPTRPLPASAATVSLWRVGCVSYLNAKPLIDGLDAQPNVNVKLDVPSRLLTDLETGAVDLAVCPVIDYHRSRVPLEVLPVGGISSRGVTLTVRLFSRVPLDRITCVHVDRDSHTSVVLMQVLLAHRTGRVPRVLPYQAPPEPTQAPRRTPLPSPQALLLIGDKVVANQPTTANPTANPYPHELDLGQAWHELTGLPFVFAVWMGRAGRPLNDLPDRLRSTREHNATRLDRIAARYAPAHGWPVDLAYRYLSGMMRYEIGPEEHTAMQRFGCMAHELGLIGPPRPIRIHPRD